jgi:hypothetical protein
MRENVVSKVVQNWMYKYHFSNYNEQPVLIYRYNLTKIDATLPPLLIGSLQSNNTPTATSTFVF